MPDIADTIGAAWASSHATGYGPTSPPVPAPGAALLPRVRAPNSDTTVLRAVEVP